jgi:hypothetical protein
MSISAPRALAIGTGVALLAAGGCGMNSTQFEGSLAYGNLISEEGVAPLRARARTELLNRAQSFGITPETVNDRRIVFRMGTPEWEFPLPGGGSQTRPDPRVITVTVDLGNTSSARYSYRASVSGKEPEGFTTEARGRLGLAMLALREIFESPISTNFIEGMDLGRIYEINPAMIAVGRRGALRPRTGVLALDEALRLASAEATRLGFAVETPEQGVLVLRDAYDRPAGDIARVGATLTFELIPGGRSVRRLVLELNDEPGQIDSGYRTPEGAIITTNDLLADRLGRVAMAVADGAAPMPE